MEIWYLLIAEKFLFWSFWEWEIRPFLSQKVDGKMLFTDYWKVLVLNFLVIGNTVFFWAKKLMERWYLLINEKFLSWTLRWWKIRSFFSQKVDEKMKYTWSFWAFHDIPGHGKYGFSRNVIKQHKWCFWTNGWKIACAVKTQKESCNVKKRYLLGSNLGPKPVSLSWWICCIY